MGCEAGLDTSTGTIKFEILCQDGRTNKPVDLHFLTLPFSDGNMTIPAPPLKGLGLSKLCKVSAGQGRCPVLKVHPMQ